MSSGGRGVGYIAHGSFIHEMVAPLRVVVSSCLRVLGPSTRYISLLVSSDGSIDLSAVPTSPSRDYAYLIASPIPRPRIVLGSLWLGPLSMCGGFDVPECRRCPEIYPEVASGTGTGAS